MSGQCVGAKVLVTAVSSAQHLWAVADEEPMEAPAPVNERERLEALQSFDILDTAFEETFDRATRLAAHIMGTPISVVSLVDENRQWFKSVVGLDARETPRSVAFCSHAILDDEVMVVEDATEDPRFSGNPLVLGDPNIRFYAGAPLIVGDGIRLGTLCVIDRKPRTIGEEQQALLRDLAGVVMDELWLRKGLTTQRQINQRLVEQTLRAQLANQSLEQFAYIASHDLRAPLKQLINITDLIDDEPEEADTYLPIIRRSAIQMEELVVGYRRLSMLQPGQNEDVRLAEVIDRARTRVEPEMTVEREGDGVLTSDSTLLVQLFVNLFVNAQQHGSDGVVRCEIIELAGELDDDQVEDDFAGSRIRIRVSNRVDQDFQVDRSVFAPFRRLGPGGDGRGLGLAIVDRIVNINNGSSDVWCDNGVFTVEIALPVRSSG